MGSEKIGCEDSKTNKMMSNSKAEPFHVSGWDPVTSFNHDGNFLTSSSVAVPRSNQFHDPHSPVVFENQPKSHPRSANFSDMMASFGHLDDQKSGPFHQILSKKQGKNPCQVSEDGAFGGSSASAKGKRKTSEAEQLRDSAMEMVDDPGKNSGPVSRGKPVKTKENYVHVRAKRGQATNSHSLAERVRRERISERMKMLQDLVPGCDKITGKAVMLDEIINYVQSLQQQVEFLSMKLATVNSDFNIDLERILPSEVYHPQRNDATVLCVNSELIYPQTFQGLTPQVAMNGFAATNPPFHHLSPNLWNNELQSIHRTGFDSNH